MTQLSARSQDLMTRLRDLLEPEDRFHPIGCSTWTEAALVALELAADAIERLDPLDAENTHLRVIHQRVGCPYGHVTASGGCVLGYPGCACMDDLLALQAWSPEDEEKAAFQIAKRLSATRAVLVDAQSALQLAAVALAEAGRTVLADACQKAATANVQTGP